MPSLFPNLVLMSSCFHKGEKVPLQSLFSNFGEKPAFQKDDFSATFSPLFKESALEFQGKLFTLERYLFR